MAIMETKKGPKSGTLCHYNDGHATVYFDLRLQTCALPLRYRLYSVPYGALSNVLYPLYDSPPRAEQKTRSPSAS